MRVFITGGAGFIASHLAEAIKDKFNKLDKINWLIVYNPVLSLLTFFKVLKC